MLTKPSNIYIDSCLNPEVIVYNKQVLALFWVLTLLYKLDVHTLKDQTGESGYAPKLIRTDGPIYRIDTDYKVSLKKIKRYGDHIG